MNDNQRQPLDEAAMDALIARVARVNAPDDFAARVRLALDSRDSTSRSHPWLRPTLAAAAILLAVALWWWRQPVPVKLEALREARVVAPEARVASTSAARPATADRPLAPLAPLAPRAPYAPVPVLVDHDRALEALDDLPAVQQATIDLAAIGTRTIDVQPADAIAPLTIDDSHADPGGEGDHR